MVALQGGLHAHRWPDGIARPCPEAMPRGNGSACLHDERQVNASLLALQGFTERCTADLAGFQHLGEKDKLNALLFAAESAKLAAQAAGQLAADARYLAGFLMGAGVSLKA